MADKTIPELPAASLPLAGSEILPIVQNGATVKVSVANLNEGRTVIGTTTLNVPLDYPTIQAAVLWLSDKSITPGETVTIQVANGTYDFTGSPLILNHPDGAQIRLVGNETTPTNCVLTWTGSSSGVDGIVVSDGHTLGYLNGFHITRNAHAGFSNTTGVLALNNATIICGLNMRVSNHYYGIAARAGSYVKCLSAVVDGAGDVGIWAFVGSTVDCNNATVTNTADPLNPLGFGIQAEYGSAIICTGASASGNKISGFAALSGSSMRAASTTANSNTGSGFFARDGGTIEAHNATANNNTRYGVEELTNGTIFANGITLAGNTLGSFAPSAQLNSSPGLGARVSSTVGALRLDTADTSSVFFNTLGGLQFEVANTSNAVNRPRVTGSAAGASVRFGAEGSDANIGVDLRGKGSGALFLGSHRANFVRINPETAGVSPLVTAEGSDANIDLRLAGKGASGYVDISSLIKAFGAVVSLGAPDSAGAGFRALRVPN